MREREKENRERDVKIIKEGMRERKMREMCKRKKEKER